MRTFDDKNERWLVLPPSGGADTQWHVCDGGDTCVIRCFGMNRDLPQGKPLARRVAACLNAFRGVSTSEIEKRFPEKRFPRDDDDG